VSYRKQSVDVNGSTMEILLFLPGGDGPVPGIVVAQHLPIAHAGLEKDPFTLDVGERMAAAGYACVIPYLFHWWPPQQDIAIKREAWRDDWTIADLEAANAVLTGIDRVDASRIGIIGHCWGGRIAYLGACRFPLYRVCATLYGGRIKVAMGEDSTPPIELTDRIRGKVIGIFGNDDENPSPADVDDIDAALTAAGVDHEFHRYDGAGHGFQDFVNDERFRREATVDSWARIMAFFARELEPAQSASA
jgi:carboxymethylenebutenolidase